MATLTYAQKTAFGEVIAQFVREHAAALKKAGFDPAKKLRELEEIIRVAVDLEVEQETQKAQLAKKTRRAVSAIQDCYKQASSLVDTMAGLFGKGSAMAKRLRKLREQMANVALRGKRSVPIS